MVNSGVVAAILQQVCVVTLVVPCHIIYLLFPLIIAYLIKDFFFNFIAYKRICLTRYLYENITLLGKVIFVAILIFFFANKDHLLTMSTLVHSYPQNIEDGVVWQSATLCQYLVLLQTADCLALNHVVYRRPYFLYRPPADINTLQ